MRSVGAALAVLVGCSSAGEHAEGPVATAPPASSVGGPSGSVRVEPVSDVEPPKVESPFVAVANLDMGSEPRIFGLGSTLVVAVKNYKPQGSDDVRTLGIATVQGDSIVFDDKDASLELMADLGTLAGSWPDNVDELVEGTNGRTGIAEHYTHKAGGGWQSDSPGRPILFVQRRRDGRQDRVRAEAAADDDLRPGVARRAARPRAGAQADTGGQEGLSHGRAKGTEGSTGPSGAMAPIDGGRGH